MTKQRLNQEILVKMNIIADQWSIQDCSLYNFIKIIDGKWHVPLAVVYDYDIIEFAYAFCAPMKCGGRRVFQNHSADEDYSVQAFVETYKSLEAGLI